MHIEMPKLPLIWTEGVQHNEERKKPLENVAMDLTWINFVRIESDVAVTILCVQENLI